MLFHVYGGNGIYQWIAMLAVLAGLILLNEFARRTKFGGLMMFGIIPLALTVYFIVIAVCAGQGVEWAVNNQTHLYMNGWFHYAKLYAALAGCIGFMMIKYEWGIGKKQWFRAFPFVIVAINILIAVASDFESAINGWYSWWLSSEDVWLYGGWHNVMNGIAGILNILCMTGWWKVYSSKDKKDMIWPDMIWVYIVVYDIWNFAYTYNCLPTHSWFCGVALLLAPTIAALIWNKGGWNYEPCKYTGNLVYVCPDFSTVSGDYCRWNNLLSMGNRFQTVCRRNGKWHCGRNFEQRRSDRNDHRQRTGTDCKCHCIRIHHLQIGKEQEESVYQRSIYRLQVL